MNKKHSKALASILARHGGKIDKDGLVRQLCSWLKSDNPSFNETKFRDACYGKFGTGA